MMGLNPRQRKRFSIKRIILYLAIILISPFIALWLYALLLMDCGDIVIGAQDINVSPIVELTFDDETSSVKSHFQSYKPHVLQGINQNTGRKQPDGIIEWISDGESSLNQSEIYLFDSIDSASKFFDFHCAHQWYEPILDIFQFEGSGSDRYCMSYINEYRSDPEGLCRPSGVYGSFILFQKENMLIQVSQHGKTQSRQCTEAQIKQLASILTRVSVQK